MDNKNLPPEQISESRSSGHTSQLTDAEALQLQQLTQLSYWNQLNRQSESSQPTAAGDERRSVPAQWHLLGHHSLYSWQRKALAAWETAGNRGIIKVVTGAGKP